VSVTRRARVVQRIKADESKLARYSRAFLGWAFGLVSQVAAVGPDVVQSWTLKRWLWGLGLAAIPGIAGLISVGQRNPAPPADQPQPQAAPPMTPGAPAP
jgi:hypothetical protein